MPDIGNVVKKTGEILRDRRRLVKWAFQPSPNDVRLLSPQEQLERFLGMTPDTIRELTAKWGEDEVKKYIRTQLRNYRHYGTRPR